MLTGYGVYAESPLLVIPPLTWMSSVLSASFYMPDAHCESCGPWGGVGPGSGRKTKSWLYGSSLDWRGRQGCGIVRPPEWAIFLKGLFAVNALQYHMRIALCILALLSSLLIHVTAEAEEPKFLTEEQLAKYLQERTTCKMGSLVYDDGRKSAYCKVQFRGLEVEFAGINNPGSRTIYVNSLGKNQHLSLSGQHCITVIFRDEDLNFHGVGAHILFMDDGTITHRYKNERAWRTCHGMQ